MAVTFAAPVGDTPARHSDLFVSFPISKMEKDARGNLIIHGVATDGTVDSDRQIVDSDWSAKALTEWLATGGNVRMSHDSKRPIGKGTMVQLDRDGDGKHWVKSVIVDPLAIKLVEEGVLRAYSVGICDPVIKRDPTGKAPGGIICGGTLAELSVVDRPANKNAYLELAKAAADGSAQLTGKMYADPDLMSRIGESIASVMADEDIVHVALPRKAKVSVTPSDLAALLKSRDVDAVKRQMDPDVGGGVDRDKIPAADFAGRNRSFPIVTPGDVSDAASSIGRAGSDNYSSDQLKANIIRIARRKGPSFVAELPDSWTNEGEGNKAMDTEVVDEAEAIVKAKGKKPFPGAAPPIDGADSDGDGKDTDKPGSHLDDEENPPAKVKPGSHKGAVPPAADGGKPAPDDADNDSSLYDNEGADKPSDDGGEDASGSTSQKGMMACPKCKAMCKDGDKECGKCGGALMKSKSLVKGAKDCKGCGKEYHADSKLKRCENCNAKLPKATKASKGVKITAGRTQPTPADGVTGESASPVAPHREPDGPAVEQFEADLKIPTDPDSNYVKAVRRLKSIGVPEDMGTLHDLMCPAYHPVEANAAYPFASLEKMDTSLWQLKALDAAAGAPLDQAKTAAKRWQDSVTITETHPELLAELRMEAHKAFSDANAGPGSAPKPTEITAYRFNRPLITAGHARPSRQHEGPNTGPRPGQITPNQFDREFLQAGRAQESPANKTGLAVEPPPTTGHPSRVFYSNAQRDNARQAMTALHDHIAQTFPDLCPMCAPGAPTVNHGVPEAQKTVEPTAPAETPVVEPLTPDVARLVAKGLITIDEARKALAPDPVVKTKKTKKDKPQTEILDADAVKALLSEVIAPLHAQLEEANKALAAARNDNQELRKTVDAIASQPDPATSPWRGQAILQSLPTPGATAQKSAPMDAAEIAAQAQQAVARELQHQFDTSTDPSSREAAWAALSRMRGMR